MKIAIDIDNTLVDYRKSIENSLKTRKYSLNLEDNILNLNVNYIKFKIKNELGDNNWQFIQGDIYSDISNKIIFYKNCIEVIKQLISKDHEIYLVSHKTKFGIKDSKETNILEIAQSRIFKLIDKNHLHKGIKSIIFCDTFDEKIDFLKVINPKIIIDDLEKIHNRYFASGKEFSYTKHILFSGNNKNINNCDQYKKKGNLVEVENWKTISNLLR